MTDYDDYERYYSQEDTWPEGFVPKAQLECLDQVKDWVEEIVHQMYNIGNASLLENAVEELCHILNVDIPDKKVKFQRNWEAFPSIMRRAISQVKEVS